MMPTADIRLAQLTWGQRPEVSRCPPGQPLAAEQGTASRGTSLNSSQRWIKPSHTSWSFPNCNRASWEKRGVSGFPEEAAATGAAVWAFPPGIWRGGPGNTQTIQQGWDPRSPCSPQVSPCIFPTHMVGWDPIRTKPSKSPQNRGNFSKPEKLGLQPAVPPRVTQLIKQKAGAGIRKSSEQAAKPAKKASIARLGGGRQTLNLVQSRDFFYNVSGKS